MYFALGFLVAGLLTLLFLPAHRDRAIRLATRRLAMQMPLSSAEIAAERDHLRAEHAVESRRIEQKHEALLAARAGDLGELGRRAARIVNLEAAQAELHRDLGDTGSKLAQASAALAASHAEGFALHKELHDKSAACDETLEKLQALEREHRALNVVCEQQRGAIAGLETRVSGLDLRLIDAGRQAGEADKVLAAKAVEAKILLDERNLAHAQVKGLTARREALQLETERQRESIEALGAQKEAEARRRAAEAARESAVAARRDAAVADAAAREADLHRRLDEAAARAADRDAAHAEQAEALRSKVAALDGALQAARDGRARSARVEARALAAEAADPRGDELLRAAIADLGDRFLRDIADGTEIAAKPLPHVVKDASPASPPAALPRVAKQAKRASGARVNAES